LDLQQTELEPIAIEVLALAALEPEAALAAVVESFAAEQSSVIRCLLLAGTKTSLRFFRSSFCSSFCRRHIWS
jgi:hypothetical protein